MGVLAALPGGASELRTAISSYKQSCADHILGARLMCAAAPPPPCHCVRRTHETDAQATPWSRTVAPPGLCNRGEVRYGSIGGLEYEVPQSRLYCLCINVALCSTALQCICRAIRRSSMTMKAYTYYIIFGRPPITPSSPLTAPLRYLVI